MTVEDARWTTPLDEFVREWFGVGVTRKPAFDRGVPWCRDDVVPVDVNGEVLE